VVVKELLELLIDKVDGDLLKAVLLKDLKAGNIKHSSKLAFFMVGSIRVSLHLMMSHLKILSKVALAIPPTP
jgi:hypothetical protein